MSWNQCLYQYHQKCGGQYLGGRENDGLLVLTWKGQPLAVDLFLVSGARSGALEHVRARIPVTLPKPYRLTIGAERALSGGVNTVLKTMPALSGYDALPADFGFPEVTKKRLIRSNNHAFTKLVLGSLEFRNALAACPEEKLELLPGLGEDGLHLLTVTTAAPVTGGAFGGDGGWYLAGDYDPFVPDSQAENARIARTIEAEFVPRMDHFLNLCRAAWDAVTQWPI